MSDDVYNTYVPLEMTPDLTYTLLNWYENNKRELPWRKTFLPYHIWISEMMLQQTQMVRGVKYFERWMNRFPDITSVAQASIEELYKYWEGLGYYSRVRNIHLTAKQILDEHNGVIPHDVTVLESLNGIGHYTARAIASIAYNQNVPVVDANVLRIIARLFGIKENIQAKTTKNTIYSITSALLPIGNARNFNQAMMEFGAVICNKNPQCSACPLTYSCFAYKNNCVMQLPLQKTKQPHKHYTTMAIILFHKDSIFMRKRPNSGLWANLWEFPEYVFTPNATEVNQQLSLFTPKNQKQSPSMTSTKPQPSIPKAYDAAKAFYDEYKIPIAVFESFITTKYAFTTNKVTLFAFCALPLHDTDSITSFYHSSQESNFYPKNIVLQRALSAGQNSIRKALLQHKL